MFKLTIIGKYGPYPKAGGATSSYLLTIGDKHVLIDLGSGSLTRIQQIMDISDIDAIIFSHLHGDHTADAAVLGYAVMLKKLPRISVYLPDAPQPQYDAIRKMEQFETETISEATTIDLFGANVTFKQTQHPVLCYAIKVAYENKAFVFSADTVYDTSLSTFAKDCDVFLCDSAVTHANHPDAMPHPSAKQAALMAKEAGAKRLLLTHISPEADEDQIFIEAKKEFDLCVVVEEGKDYYI